MSDLIPRQSTKTSSINTIPQPSAICMVKDCSNDTQVRILKVTVQGRVRCGSFSDFGYTKKQGEEIFYTLREGYQYDGWITRCGQCYLRDLDTCKKSTLHQLGKQSEGLANANSGTD